MINYAIIHSNDDPTEPIIYLGYELFRDDDEIIGYRVCTSNNDDVGYSRAQSIKKCKKDIRAMWENWDSFKIL